VGEEDIFLLYADLPSEKIKMAKKSRTKPRIVLASSLAEVAVTIPDVDVVLNSGISRFIDDDDDIPLKFDYLASAVTNKQREGRAGRTKRGCHVQFIPTDDLRAHSDLPVSANEIMRVIALEQFHEKIPVSSCRFAFLSDDETAAARQRFKELRLEKKDLEAALTKVPLPLHLSAIVLKARGEQIAYEAAAVVALKAEGRWPSNTTFTVEEIVKLVKGRLVKKDMLRIDKVQALFWQMVDNLALKPSVISMSRVEERLALCFLVAPERLVWSINKVGAFLGQTLVNDCISQYFVAALLSSPHYGKLRSALSLPFSDWVKKKSGLQPPKWTAKFVGDSTFLKFRTPICVHIRKQTGHDIRFWSCRGGAWETSLAETLAAAPHTDLTIMSPNGNRLSLQSQCREPEWLRRNAEQVCGGLRATSTYGVVFVGDAGLSPGVKYGRTYASLSQLYRNIYENLGVPLVNQAPGVELESDGLHWKVASQEAVLHLVDDLVKNSALTESFANHAPAPLWYWKYNETAGRHYPQCKICEKLACDQHLVGKVHAERCHGSSISFNFHEREQLCFRGQVFLLADGTVDSRAVIEPDRPLLMSHVPGSNEPTQEAVVTLFEIIECMSSLPVVKNTRLPRSLLVRIHWSRLSFAEDSFSHAFVPLK
jgi:hypothetical protein